RWRRGLPPRSRGPPGFVAAIVAGTHLILTVGPQQTKLLLQREEAAGEAHIASGQGDSAGRNGRRSRQSRVGRGNQRSNGSSGIRVRARTQRRLPRYRGVDSGGQGIRRRVDGRSILRPKG